MDRAKLLDRQPTLVRADVFLHDLAPLALEHLRCALAQGLTPSDVEIGDDGIVILRFTRPRAGETRLIVGVELHPEANELVGNVYDGESKLIYATEPRDAKVAGSVRATVSRLLRELATKVAGDLSF